MQYVAPAKRCGFLEGCEVVKGSTVSIEALTRVNHRCVNTRKLLSVGLASALLTLVYVSPVAAAYFEVTRTDDQVDSDPGDGACVAQNGGGCSLRAAIQEANALSGNDYIYLPPGTYELTIAGSGENLAATGDLDIESWISLTGTGWKVTTIAMTDYLDRIFDIDGFSTLELSDLALTGGSVDGRGGGIHVKTGGTLHLSRSSVYGTLARQGGCVGVESGSSATLEDSELRNCFAISDVPGNNYASGAALFADSGSVVIRRCSIHDSLRDTDPNGVAVKSSSLTVESSTIIDSANNSYSIQGDDSAVSIVSSTIGRLDVSHSSLGSCSLTLGCSLIETCATNGCYLGLNNYGYNVYLNGTDCVGSNDTDGDWNLEPLEALPGKFPARVPNRYSAAIDGGNSFVCLANDQWGQVRPHDDNGDNIAVDEVGAIEAYLIFTNGFESGDTTAW